MPQPHETVLVIAADERVVAAVRAGLADRGWGVVAAHDAPGALARLESSGARIAIVAERVGTRSGLELVRACREKHPHLEWMLVCPGEPPIEAWRAGAVDCLREGCARRDLLAALDRCLARADATAEHRRTRQALERSEARFQIFTDLAAAWFWELDAQLNVTYLSRGFAAFAGVPVAAVRGRSAAAMFESHGVSHGALARFETALRSHQPFQDLELEWPDGARAREGAVIIQNSGQPLAGADGAFAGYRGVSRDVSRERLTERALTLSESRFRDFAETAADWLWELDAELRYTYFSEGLRRLSGQEPADYLGKTRHEVWSARAVNPRAAEENDAVLGARRAYQDLLVEWVEDDGTRRFFRNSGKPRFGSDGRFLGYRGTTRDVTSEMQAERARRQLEGQLRQAQRMESIGQLAGGIAHDFNNILGSVLGFLELALEYHVEDKQGKLARFLQESKSAAERARDLVEQLLVFSRGGEGEFEEHALAPLIEESTKLLRMALPASVQLVTWLRGSLPPVRTHPVQLGQVLLNLCLNASRAQDARGTIVLASTLAHPDGAHCASCSARLEGAYVQIAVRDSGVGIPAEVQARIFEPFFTTGASRGGSGMGLAVVHGIVHDHGGHVLVESVPGEGAQFAVLLPPAPLEAGETVLPARRGGKAGFPELSGRHVMVVDDERTFGEFVRELLELHGCRVRLERDSRAALRQFEQAPGAVDLVIADFAMPSMNGTDLALAMLERRPELPFILCTGYMERLRAEDTEALGIRAVLRKPVASRALLGNVSRCLERSGSAA